MTIYWLMFAVPSLLAMMPWKATPKLSKLVWGATATSFILVVGLRFEVGADWMSYLMRFRETYGVQFSDAVRIYRDPGYYFFNWIFANAGFELWAVNLFCAVLSVSGVIAFAGRQPQPWVALAVAVPYMLVVVCMGYTRQSAAFGLFCWALLAVQDRLSWRFLMLVIAAATFHKSAVIAMPLYLFTLPRIKIRHWILLVAMLVTMVAVLIAETFEAKWHTYVEQQLESEGALIRVTMNFPPALVLLLLRKKLRLNDSKSRHWYWMAWTSLAAVIMVKFASTAVDRLALYLLPLQMVVYARAYLLFKERLYRSILSIGVLLFYAMVLFVWLNLGVHADAWLPYRFYSF